MVHRHTELHVCIWKAWQNIWCSSISITVKVCLYIVHYYMAQTCGQQQHQYAGKLMHLSNVVCDRYLTITSSSTLMMPRPVLENMTMIEYIVTLMPDLITPTSLTAYVKTAAKPWVDCGECDRTCLRLISNMLNMIMLRRGLPEGIFEELPCCRISNRKEYGVS